MDFADMHDMASLCVLEHGIWRCLLKDHHMLFTLDHFTGYKAALYLMATQQPGGSAIFTGFHLQTFDSAEEAIRS